MKLQPLTYMDTSAYLAIVLVEPGAKHCADFLYGKKICSSALLIIEAERNIVRLAREKKLNPLLATSLFQRIRTDSECLVLKDVDIEIGLTGEFPAVHLPRSNDLAHLRTALWFQRHAPLSAFVTLDRDQGAAAMELGLPVMWP